MTVKFRVGFDIDGETLFGVIAKMLPIDNLSVEELAPHTGTPILRVPVHRKFKRKSPGPNLTKGINAIIVTALKEKSLRSSDLQPLAEQAGFSRNSINSRLESLHQAGVIERAGGKWRLKATGGQPNGSA